MFHAKAVSSLLQHIRGVMIDTEFHNELFHKIITTSYGRYVHTATRSTEQAESFQKAF